MPKTSASNRSIYAALIGNLLVAATKAVAATLTGSSAMSSEAVHSFVDCGNEILLLYGQHRAARPPDELHPLGHGRELYFWSFIVALMIFALGSGISIYQGISRIRDPRPLESPLLSYVVLAIAFVLEAVSWFIAVRQYRDTEGRSERGVFESFRRSKNPPLFMVLFEDSAALVGIVIAALGIYASTALQMPVFDGVASTLIGILLGVVALLLARESKSLLIGESASHELADSIRAIAAREPGVLRVNGLLSAQLGPDQILFALSLEFADDLRAPQIEEHVAEIERRARASHPTVVALFVKPQTPKVFAEAVLRRTGEPPPAAGSDSPSTTVSSA